jgi:NADPH:quinone reductase-like Zn-dependent oxidoreductase
VGVVGESDSASFGPGQTVIVADSRIEPLLAAPAAACFAVNSESASQLSHSALSLIPASSFALACVRKSGIRLGEPAMVVGNDALSLLVVQWARLQGATPLVFASSAGAEMLETARRLGADHAIDPADRLESQVAAVLCGRGLGVVLDCLADEALLGRLLALLRYRGRLMLMADRIGASASLNLCQDLHLRELDLTGLLGYSTWLERLRSDVSWKRQAQISIDFLRLGRLQLDPLLASPVGAQPAKTHSGASPWRCTCIDWKLAET